MYRHFESAIRPLLDVTRLSTIVEVGAEDGLQTFKLLPYVRSRKAHLHNWYTVIEELRIIDRTYAYRPLTFTHDIEWPYGRRDMYYAPERVPEDCRQPYAQLGVVLGRSELSHRGMNPELANATHEGGPRNGVLTAIEDFLDETQRNLMFFIVPGAPGSGSSSIALDCTSGASQRCSAECTITKLR